jgi:hypothetical protein
MSLEALPPEEDARAILPLTHDLGRLQLLAQTQLPEELLELQDFAVKPRSLPGFARCGLNWSAFWWSLSRGRLRQEPEVPYTAWGAR